MRFNAHSGAFSRRIFAPVLAEPMRRIVQPTPWIRGKAKTKIRVRGRWRRTLSMGPSTSAGAGAARAAVSLTLLFYCTFLVGLFWANLRWVMARSAAADACLRLSCSTATVVVSTPTGALIQYSRASRGFGCRGVPHGRAPDSLQQVSAGSSGRPFRVACIRIRLARNPRLREASHFYFKKTLCSPKIDL